MDIHFTYAGREIDVACNESDTVKLYAVPTGYSEDGLYAAVWRAGEVEPFPACDGNEAHLLAEVYVQQGQDGAVIGGSLTEGVEAYATH